MPPNRDLERLFRILARTRAAILRAASSPHRADVVAMGADGTPTEELDRVAEAAIIAGLDDEGVPWDLVSEEIGHLARGGPLTLVVDPLDGTSNAVRGLPFAAISLALGERDLGGIEIGVVCDLDRGTTYWATRGGGAFKDGRPIRVRPWNARHDLLFLNLGERASRRALALARAGRRVRSLGCASLEIAKVAEGSGDAYVFDNAPAEYNLRATDIAAGYRLLSEAGGGLCDFDGRSIDRFPLEVRARTSVVAWGDPAFVDEFSRRAAT